MIVTRPYINPVTGYYLMINELLTCLFYIFIGVSSFSNTNINPRKAQLTGLYLIIMSLVAYAISSAFDVFKSVRDFIRVKRFNISAKVEGINTVTDINIQQKNAFAQYN